MVEVKKNIKWNIRNMKKELLLKRDTNHRIIGPDFRMNLNEDIYDSW
jgi:hypothetical protein